MENLDLMNIKLRFHPPLWPCGNFDAAFVGGQNFFRVV